jgi:hypothetical protein
MSTKVYADSMKQRDTMPKGFTCECGEFHHFVGYVYAHWDIRLTHECEKCGAKHSIRLGRAELTRKPRKRKEQSR